MGFVKDEGDGLFNARTYGTYTEDPALYTLQLGEDGVADTGFILPSDTEWIITEVFDVEGIVGHIGLTVYNADVTNITADIEALRQEALGVYNTFRITTTHYLTGNKVDRYRGDENGVALKRCGNVDYTPPTTVWLITAITMSNTCGIYDQVLRYDVTNIETEFLDSSEVVPDYIAMYKLDDDSSDETGHYDGVDTDMTYENFSGLFNGSTSKVDILFNNSSYTGGLTISLWYKVNNLNDIKYLVSKRSDGNDFETKVDTDGSLGFTCWGLTDIDLFTPASLFSVGGFHNLIYQYDGANLSIFINGTLGATTASTGNIDNTSNGMSLMEN